MLDDAWLSEKNAWKRVADIPGFPYADWGALREALCRNDVRMSVSYPDANVLAPVIEGRSAKLWQYVGGSPPIVAILASVGLFAWSHNAGFLWSIPVAIAGFLSGSPVAHKGCRVLSLIWIIGAVCFVLSVVRRDLQLAFPCAVYVFVAWCIGAFYEHNADVVREAATGREAFFLYAWERGVVVIADGSTGKRIPAPPST